MALWTSTIWWVTSLPALYPATAKTANNHQFLPSNFMYGLKSSKLTSGVWEFFAILRKSMSQMRILFVVVLSSVSFFAMSQWDDPSDGLCCDSDSPSPSPLSGPVNCTGPYGGYDGGLGPDNQICDPDCEGYVDCTTIPLDGGLSLLAIAGGGLATAAMRRRREEELLEKEA